MNAKRFFYVCAGLFLLVAAYSLGAHRADAQSGGQFAGISVYAGTTTAITSSGDVYAINAAPSVASGTYCEFGWSPPYFGCVNTWTYLGNVLGGTVPAAGSTWSGVKGGYRK
jgi:hypothetical protein